MKEKRAEAMVPSDEIVKKVNTNLVLNNHDSRDEGLFLPDEKVNDIQRVFIYGDVGMEKDDLIPAFTTDILFKDPDGNKYIVTDMRAYINRGEVRRPARREYNYRVVRSMLHALAASGSMTDISILPTAGLAFTRVVSSRLGHTYNLDGTQAFMVSILCAVYYGMLGMDEDEDHLSDIQAARYAAYFSGMPVQAIRDVDFEQVVTALEPTLEGLINGIKNMIDSPRLKQLSTVTFLEMLKGIMYFNGAPMEIVYGLEDTPTWVALCHLALTDRSSKKSVLAGAMDPRTSEDILTLVDRNLRLYGVEDNG